MADDGLIKDLDEPGRELDPRDQTLNVQLKINQAQQGALDSEQIVLKLLFLFIFNGRKHLLLAICVFKLPVVDAEVVHPHFLVHSFRCYKHRSATHEFSFMFKVRFLQEKQVSVNHRDCYSLLRQL